ncbi:hypothetical protein L226DRAFT_539304 [Lentinus tigrinus ALCF2SS1-7]|uniref:Uncharacterized protein n=1 Tax=Lentinus tigrinus ALCF2SS1-6 TaxID=1328759 RepID=A0A5C2RTL3_9APHY|nr:hypothetical protein L227DRAFT_580366 [Lentinus tigrinus ALCF2SS1-6]RPD70055.1 hypothetical protein L226DRAFT_539304 [Lentinus tigrinus ALCF2SS1-7]
MSHQLKKRKRRAFDTHGHDDQDGETQPDPSLFIQAHEADLVHGPQAAIAARSLEVLRSDVVKGPPEDIVGDGLIQWSGGRRGANTEPGTSWSNDEDHIQLQSRPVNTAEDVPNDRDGCWVDRYDARLLLDSLPNFNVPPSPIGVSSEPGSPGGWSDLPSDAEDTFFFSAGETEDYRRDKRRRVIDRDREARLNALRAEDGDGDDESGDPREQWGGSDEEPDNAQRELMRRTAAHIMSSPNAAQLEMRILANHGADPRFAFLRGRWSRAWRLTKGKLRLEREAEKRKAEEEVQQKSKTATLGGLAGYGSSDSEEEDNECTAAEVYKKEDVPVEKPPSPVEEPKPPVLQLQEPNDDTLKAARRARAREWAEKRRAAKESGEVAD